MLLEPLASLGEQPALRVGERALSYAELRGAAGAVAARVAGLERVAVWATASPETVVAVVGALLAGVPAVPLNPGSGTRELAHILGDAAPGLLLHAPDAAPPAGLGLAVEAVDAGASAPVAEADPGPEATALVVYTSGTTGPPKGVLMPRRAIATNLDALAAAWGWTAADRLVHALPLFHVHGLVLGTLGPLRCGGSVEHLGRFSPEGLVGALGRGASMAFGVPTMWSRVADAAEADPSLAGPLGRARLLVSGSAALPAALHARIERLSGQRIVERYGMSETLMTCAVRADGERRAGSVGPPVDGVELRLLDDEGAVLDVHDDETIGEIAVRGPNVMTGYLGRPEATAAAFCDGFFRTGDLATRARDGYVRIVGRRATDLISSGGFRIGAGEIESALLEHPGVAEAAVTGEPDEDLGERVVAWIVPAAGARPDGAELADHVAALLTGHKHPRVVHLLDALPRNEMGKVQKRALTAEPPR